MITLEQLTDEVRDLAPLPAAAAKLAQLAADMDADTQLIVDTIRYDQALTARVLRYANSPAAGSYYRIRSVKDAVVRLGLGKLLELAISAHVSGQMQTALPEYGLGEIDLWRHSVASATAADLLTRQRSNSVPPESFSAALLHDIGKLVLARHLDPPSQESIKKFTDEYSMTYYQAELEVLGFTHASIGSSIAKRWSLDETICSAIGHHHDVDADHGSINDIVQIGNVVAKTIGFGLGHEGLNLAANAAACERLDISRDEFEGLCAETSGLMNSIDEFYA